MGLFVTVGDGEEIVFLERLADDLETDGEVALGKATGDGEGREAGQVHIDGEDVAQVHRDRIIHPFSEFEGRSRGCRGQQGIDLLEGIEEVLPNQIPNFLSTKVVGIVVAGTEHEATETNAAFDLSSKAFTTGFKINIQGIGRFFAAMGVANAIIAG